MRLIVALVLVLTALLFTRAADAAGPTKAQCVAANEQAESMKKRGALRAARASLVTCANPACPRLVQNDCNLRITEIDAAMPTMTFSAKNGRQDTTAVTIAMDGESIAKQADGKAVSVDPGEHSFTFELAGFPPQTQKLVVREGEKNRNVLVQFGEPEPPSGRLVVTSGPAAAIAIDGRPTAVGRFEGPLSAGKHEVKISESGKIAATRTVEVKANATETLDVTLEPEKRSVLPWVLGGAAVVTAALVVGGVLLLSSSGDKSVPPPQGSLGGVGLASFR